MQDGTQENVIHIPSPSMSRWQSDFKTNLTSGSGLRSLDIVSMNLTVRTFDRVFQNLLYVLYASDRKAEVFPDPPLLYKNPHHLQPICIVGRRSKVVCHVILLSRDTLLVSAKIRRKESLADGELLPFARICRKETLAELQPDGELSGFCCNAWKTSTHPCGVSTHDFLSSGNFTISPQRISKTSCLQIYKPSHRKSSCNVSQGTARRCSSLPFQGVGDNLFHL